jgi:hypothetical protein
MLLKECMFTNVANTAAAITAVSLPLRRGMKRGDDAM